MKKRQIFSILILTVLLLNFSLAVTQTTKSSANPISSFMQKEVSSPLFKFIGAPEQLPMQNLIIYMLILFVIIIIIYDVLEITGIFNKKLINMSISIIITLIGIQQKIIYNLIQPLLNITSIANSLNYIGIGTIILIAVVMIVGLKVLKNTIFKKMKEDVDKEKAEERAEKIRLQRRVQDIEAKAAGI